MARFNGIPVEQDEKEKKSRFVGIPIDENQTEEHDFSFAEMAKNIPGSAANLAQDMYQTVRHPIETAKGLGKAAAGGLYKANENAKEFIPKWMTKPIIGNDKVFGADYSTDAEAIADALKDRYGSIDAAKQTLERDPVGAMADLASVISGAGGVLKSNKLSQAGAALNPINAASNIIKYSSGKLASVLPEKLSPAALYEGAAKFSTTMPERKRQRLVQTALDNKIMPSTSGVRKLEDMIGNFENEISDLIQQAQNSKKTVPRAAVYKYLNHLREKKGGVRLGAPRDLERINTIVREFDTHLTSLGKNNLTAKDLQKLKVDAWKTINWHMKMRKVRPIKDATYAAIGRAAKENIEDLAPGTKATNDKLGKLYELQEPLQRSANRIENRDILSLGAPAKVGAGTMVDPGLGTAIGAALGIMDLPKVKAATAINLNQLINDATVKQFLKNNQNISKAQLAAILSGRITEENQQEKQR
jgi:hypothetical protein